ncbi:phosphate-starvation-inducible PsiE family protein [Enterococcus camelliae]|uniref:Protein PsiE n=1 Tax=Enterococcus camelliae TaxID=453959 RepID=A0ABW5TJV3_9ENTE
MGFYSKLEKWVSGIVDIMLAILIILILVVMGEAIFNIVVQVIPLSSMDTLSSLIEEVATLFILLEIILMLLRYMKEGHHIPVRYLILISMTAILRQLLLSHDGGAQTLFFSVAILILVVVLLILEKIKAFHTASSEPLEQIKQEEH